MEPKEQDSWTNTSKRHESCGNPDPDSLVGRSCHWGNRNDRLAYRILPARGGGRDLPQHVDLTNSGQNAQCCETRGGSLDALALGFCQSYRLLDRPKVGRRLNVTLT